MTLFKTLFLSMLLGAAFFVISSEAHARSFFEVLFGDEESRDGPKPEETLQAPFSTKPAASATNKNPLMEMYGKKDTNGPKNTLTIDQPHISPEEIASWAAGIVSQGLSFAPKEIPIVQARLANDFSAFGMQEYQEYLKKSGIVDTLTLRKLKALAIYDGPAQVIREGVVSGTYHWLVQVPVMVTYYDQNMNRIVDKNTKYGQSLQLVVQVQVGRTNKATVNETGVEIERWLVN